MDPVRIDFEAHRFVPWLVDIPIIGEAMDMEQGLRLAVSLGRDLEGAPLLSLEKTDLSQPGVGFRYSGSATIDAHVAAGRLPSDLEGFDGSEVVPLTVIGIWSDAPGLWCPFRQERGGDVKLQYDLWRLSGGGFPFMMFTGSLTILSGVLRP